MNKVDWFLLICGSMTIPVTCFIFFIFVLLSGDIIAIIISSFILCIGIYLLIEGLGLIKDYYTGEIYE